MYLSLAAFFLAAVALGFVAVLLIREHECRDMLKDVERMRDDWKRAGQRREEMRRGR